MGDSPTWTAAPAAAERARSVLAAAWSCAVTADGGREEFVGAHTVGEDGRVILDVPADSTLLAAAVCAPRGEPSAVLEFADVSPVPVRNRIRARLWMAAGSPSRASNWRSARRGWCCARRPVPPSSTSTSSPPPSPTRWPRPRRPADPPRRLPRRRRRAPHPPGRAGEPARRRQGPAARRRQARTHPAHRAGPRPRRRTAGVPPARRHRGAAHRAHAHPPDPGQRRLLPPRATAAAHRRRRVTRTARPRAAVHR